jgi:hypothetical protein
MAKHIIHIQQLGKKITSPFNYAIIVFWCHKSLQKNDDVQQ